MKRTLCVFAVAVLVALAAGTAVAQPAPGAPGDDEPAVGEPDAAVPVPDPPATTPELAPLPWTQLELSGLLIDEPARLQRIFEAELRRRPDLTGSARNDLVTFAAALGYQLVDTPHEALPGGGLKLTLVLDPIAVVRWVEVKLRQGLNNLSEDELRRRMRLRVGSALPWDADDRQSLLDDDTERVRRYLRDEGFFEATVAISAKPVGRYGIRIVIKADLKGRYQRGKITVINASPGGADLAIPLAEIAGTISKGSCVLGICRFSYSTFLEDLDKITALFQRRGYPSVRVIHDFDPLTSFDRRTHRIDIRITIDPRRKLDIVFEGNDKGRFPDDVLSRQLTFSAAATADDVEVQASARALERYFQARGYFDVAVTSERVRLGAFDRVVYRIEPGAVRAVREVRVVCKKAGDSPPGDCSLPIADLRKALGTRPTVSRILIDNTYALSSQLAADVGALTRYYRTRGFEHAQVRLEVAPTPAGWVSAAVSAAQVLSEERDDALAVRFVIDEGRRTVIEAIHVVFEGRAAGGGSAGDERRVLERVGIKAGDPYVREKLDAAAKDVADWYWQFGRPRARVAVLEPVPGRTADGVVVTLNIEESHELRIGEVLVRGNFRLHEWIVRDELGFKPGKLLTGDLFTAGPARLRSTNLFDAVKIDFIGLDDPHRDVVNVVARVEERHDVWGRADFEVGAKLYQGSTSRTPAFVRIKPSWPNVGGLGIRADGSVTAAFFVEDFSIALPGLADEVPFIDLGIHDFLSDATLRLPHWLARRYVHVPIDTELGAVYRYETTERFGPLETVGANLGLSRTWERPRTEAHHARLFAAAVRYDVRRRSRDEELVRPPGLAGDLRTNPIVTRTGTLGLTLTWDQRRDGHGNLNPLAPEGGYRLEAGVAYARPELYSQDTFVKLNALGQAFVTRGRAQLRVDARYDHGIPLAGAVLLPEVERYFAGGDSTVRGFEEDRLATELVEEPVPPLGQLTQIRIRPAGGNVRALGTLDAQVKVWRLFGINVASAMFTDAGIVTNTWDAVELADIRPSAGSGVRLLLPIGAISLEYAVPLFPHLGDNPRGRFHFAVALRY